MVDGRSEGHKCQTYMMTLSCHILITKVGGKLCIGNQCKYVLKEGSEINAQFLLDYVVPN
jgi:hypothetical protein